MFGSEMVEVAIGIILVYIIISTICSAVREGIEAIVKSRAAYLEHGIRELLHDKSGTQLANSLYNHPLINGLFGGSYAPGQNKAKPGYFARGKGLPSYIPSKAFATAILDIATRGHGTDETNTSADSPIVSLAGLRENVAKLQNPPVQRILLTAIDSAQGDLNRVQKNIETWYDSSMDRVSGWYKRRTHGIIFAIALIISVGMNVDTFRIANFLYWNDAVRAELVTAAESATPPDSTAPQDPVAQAEQATKMLEALQLPVGWPLQPQPQHLYQWLGIIAGWLLTAFAATLGAPFWFDVLNKVMVIRSTVKPHEKSPEESSEDRQNKQALQLVIGTNQGTGTNQGGGTPQNTGAAG